MAEILFFTFFPRCFRASSDLLNPETNSVRKGTGKKIAIGQVEMNEGGPGDMSLTCRS